MGPQLLQPLHVMRLQSNDLCLCVTGNIASWKKKEGEQVGAGEEMAEIETDKVHCWLAHRTLAMLPTQQYGNASF